MLNMYRFSLLLITLSFSNYLLPYAVKSPHAIVMTSKGTILFEKRADVRTYPASTTKLATALIIYDCFPELLHQDCIVAQDAIGSVTSSAKKKAHYHYPAYWIEVGSSHIGLKKDEILPAKSLMEGMLIASGNDAANTLAYAASGSIEEFMKVMDRHLRKIGCTKTSFKNPHGLHHPEHMTTAKDLAKIAVASLKHPALCSIVKKDLFNRPKTNKQPAARFAQTNRLLRKGKYHYSQAIGLKTGMTSDAGRALIAAAKKDDRTIVAVVLGADSTETLYGDVISLFEEAFSEKKITEVLQFPEQKKWIEGAKGPLIATVCECPSLSYYPSEPINHSYEVIWNENLTPQIREGTQVGYINLNIEEEKHILPLLSTQATEATWQYIWTKKWEEFKSKRAFWAVLASIVLLVSLSVFMHFARTKS